MPSPVGLRYADRSSDEIDAEEFVVVVASRPDPMEFAWGLLAPTDTILVVRWDFDAACDLMPREPGAWISKDELVVVRASSARIHEGRRVLDVAGWFWPYPAGSQPEMSFDRPGPTDPAEWLPAEDLFDLLSHSPVPASSVPREEQVKQLEDFYRGGPTRLMTRFPGPELLERWRRWAAGSAF